MSDHYYPLLLIWPGTLAVLIITAIGRPSGKGPYHIPGLTLGVRQIRWVSHTPCPRSVLIAFGQIAAPVRLLAGAKISGALRGQGSAQPNRDSDPQGTLEVLTASWTIGGEVDGAVPHLYA